MLENYNVQIGTNEGVMYWNITRLVMWYPRLSKLIYKNYKLGKKEFDVHGISVRLV